MGRNPKHLLPQMRLHKGSGHARVRINGVEHWLGPFGSREAVSAYDRLIAHYLATRGAQLDDGDRDESTPTGAVPEPEAAPVPAFVAPQPASQRPVAEPKEEAAPAE